jgi:hypothetical protein
MATQHSPDGPLSHPQHYPPPLRQPPNAGMPIPQPQQLKNSAAQWLAQTNEDVWLRLGGLSENLGDLDGATQAYERAMHHNAAFKQWTHRPHDFTQDSSGQLLLEIKKSQALIIFPMDLLHV